eukprot:TRINITY_DN6268_c0_g3_i1.p1 TRINITY_DN6268_c0_g3~~TRINITY_DN6268_c0_g3_i1.p1  ORF type:complete len:420 (+),score=-9.22 TRINITY_DN6268_c0_g3_i1:136-1260(+)
MEDGGLSPADRAPSDAEMRPEVHMARGEDLPYRASHWAQATSPSVATPHSSGSPSACPPTCTADEFLLKLLREHSTPSAAPLVGPVPAMSGTGGYSSPAPASYPSWAPASYPFNSRLPQPAGSDPIPSCGVVSLGVSLGAPKQHHLPHPIYDVPLPHPIYAVPPSPKPAASSSAAPGSTPPAVTVDAFLSGPPPGQSPYAKPLASEPRDPLAAGPSTPGTNWPGALDGVAPGGWTADDFRAYRPDFAAPGSTPSAVDAFLSGPPPGAWPYAKRLTSEPRDPLAAGPSTPGTNWPGALDGVAPGGWTADDFRAYRPDFAAPGSTPSAVDAFLSGPPPGAWPYAKRLTSEPRDPLAVGPSTPGTDWPGALDRVAPG